MGWAADRAGIQWRTLNASRGRPCATRCQADRSLYRAAIRRAVEASQISACSSRRWRPGRSRAAG